MENIYLCSDFDLSREDIHHLVLFYQPLFTYPSSSLYLSLAVYAENFKEIRKTQLFKELQITEDVFILLREELERFSLIDLWSSTDHVVIEVHKPLSAKQFLKHPSFSRLYDIVCGHESLLKMRDTFLNDDYDLNQYKRISQSFDLKRLALWDEAHEKQYASDEPEPDHRSFDADRFFKTLSLAMFPLHLRTPENYRIVSECGTFYAISFNDMRSFVFKYTNRDLPSFDSRAFVLDIERHYGQMKPEDVENIYDLDPISFIRYLQKSDYVVKADERIVQSLVKNFGLIPGVINVLLEYVWNTNKKDLNRNYIEKLASIWKQREVDSIEKALKEIAGSSSFGPKYKKETSMPDYDKDGSVENDELRRKEVLASIKKGAGQ